MGKVKSKDETQLSRPVTIGRAAAAAGLTAKAVRLYETRGLLAAPARTAAGYRLYTTEDIARLRFIAAARRLGLHIDQITEIIAAAHDNQPPCATTHAILDHRIGEIDQLIARLTELRSSLTAAQNATPDHTPASAAVCPVIENAPPRRPIRAGRTSRTRPATTGARSSRHSGANSD